MKSWLIVILFIFFLLTACSKDENVPHYSILSDNDWQNFINSHRWGLMFSIISNSDDPSLIRLSGMVSNQDAESNQPNSYSFSINEINIPFTVYESPETGFITSMINYDEEFDIPVSTSLHVKLKKNDKTILDRFIRIPQKPLNFHYPESPDFVSGTEFSWSLEHDSDFQRILFQASGLKESDEFSKYLLPSERTFNFSLQNITLQSITHMDVFCVQTNIAEYLDNFVSVTNSSNIVYNAPSILKQKDSNRKTASLLSK